MLAAIGKLECDHGRLRAPGCNPPGTVNHTGAIGPMKFLGPTWHAGTPHGAVPAVGLPTSMTAEGYAMDGDGDGIADVWNPADAIAAAARLLRANGAPADYRRAVFAYNPSDAYVEEYRGAFAPGASGSTRAVCCHLTTAPDGSPTTPPARLFDVAARYGADHPVGRAIARTRHGLRERAARISTLVGERVSAGGRDRGCVRVRPGV